jgi:hypothetical protein
VLPGDGTAASKRAVGVAVPALRPQHAAARDPAALRRSAQAAPAARRTQMPRKILAIRVTLPVKCWWERRRIIESP